MIKIDNLFQKYNNEIVYKNLNIEIEDGDYFAIIGENGSGKSTLLKSILGISKSMSGNIYIDNILVDKKKDWSDIGYVPQRTELMYDIPITVIEYLCLYAKKSKVIDIINKYNLNDLKNNVLSKLSGGQLQKVNIVKALLKDINYIFLDEPNNGLDFKNRQMLYNLLHDLNKEGITIVIVSHHVEDIKGNVHKIYDMEKNELSEVMADDCKYC